MKYCTKCVDSRYYKFLMDIHPFPYLYQKKYGTHTSLMFWSLSQQYSSSCLDIKWVHFPFHYWIMLGDFREYVYTDGNEIIRSWRCPEGSDNLSDLAAGDGASPQEWRCCVCGPFKWGYTSESTFQVWQEIGGEWKMESVNDSESCLCQVIRRFSFQSNHCHCNIFYHRI